MSKDNISELQKELEDSLPFDDFEDMNLDILLAKGEGAVRKKRRPKTKARRRFEFSSSFGES